MTLIISIIVFIRTKNDYHISTSGILYSVNKLSSDVSIVDLRSGKTIKTIKIKVEPHEITALTDLNMAVITNYGNSKKIGESLTVIDGSSHSIISNITLKGKKKPHGIQVIPNTNKVAIVNDEKSELLLVNIKNNQLEAAISTNENTSHLLAVHPTKPIAFCSNSTSNSVSVIDFKLKKVIKIIACGKGTEGIDVTPSGNEVWITNKKDNTVQMIDATTYKIIKSINVGVSPLRLKFTPDGKFCLVTNAQEGNVSVIEVASKTCFTHIELPGKKNLLDKILNHTPRPVGITMHPQEKLAYISNSNANRIEVIDLNTFTLVSRIKVGAIPDGMAILPN